MGNKGFIKFGTCSWKYDSWRGIIYPHTKKINYLREYSRSFTTVEIDQWFWSLFPKAVVLPKGETVREYADSVPADFIFSIKVPNSITLTHHYAKQKNSPLTANPHFLSAELMNAFLERIEPLGDHIGPLMFQFEYLNKKKMPSLRQFLKHFETFYRKLPAGFNYCVEIRNPHYLTAEYFDFLADRNLAHVFLQGYYMPSLFDVFEKFKDVLRDPIVIRLHGTDRQGIEERTGKSWDTIVDPKDRELAELSNLIGELRHRDHQVFINVNNHYEGSAPRTIERISSFLLEPPAVSTRTQKS